MKLTTTEQKWVDEMITTGRDKCGSFHNELGLWTLCEDHFLYFLDDIQACPLCAQEEMYKKSHNKGL